ncbi:hypothetical protein WAI453_006733 [Rhynchosporium graminicola]
MEEQGKEARQGSGKTMILKLLNGRTTCSFAGWHPDYFGEGIHELLEKPSMSIIEAINDLDVLIVELNIYRFIFRKYLWMKSVPGTPEHIISESSRELSLAWGQAASRFLDRSSSLAPSINYRQSNYSRIVCFAAPKFSKERFQNVCLQTAIVSTPTVIPCDSGKLQRGSLENVASQPCSWRCQNSAEKLISQVQGKPIPIDEYRVQDLKKSLNAQISSSTDPASWRPRRLTPKSGPKRGLVNGTIGVVIGFAPDPGENVMVTEMTGQHRDFRFASASLHGTLPLS